MTTQPPVAPLDSAMTPTETRLVPVEALKGLIDAASSFCEDGDLLSGEIRNRVNAMLSALPPREEAPEGAGTWSKDDIETLISDALSDSFDLDWDAGDGAKAVLRALEKEGLLAALRAQPQPEQTDERDALARGIDPEAFVPMEDVIGMRRAYAAADRIIARRRA